MIHLFFIQLRLFERLFPLDFVSIILGLPFLVYNCIIFNHEAYTVIDKSSNFDLLHPLPPLKLKAPKHKLKDLFKQVWQEWELLITELNMVCSNQLLHTK